MASLKLPEKLEEDSLRALAHTEKHRRATVIGHYDADGISSAAVVCGALKRLGAEFTARNIQVVTPEVMRSLIEPAEGVVFLTDLGSSMATHLAKLRTAAREIVIVDHHPPDGRPAGLVQVNAHNYAIDGTFDACSGTMAYAMALCWDERNASLFRQAIVGCIGDRQASPPRGLNRALVDHALGRRIVEEREELPLGPGPLEEEIACATDPYFRRLSDRKGAATFLKGIGLDPQAAYPALENGQKRLLTSLLIAELAEAGADSEAIARAVRTRFLFPDGEYADQLALIVDASGRMGDTGTGLAAALGSAPARARAEGLARSFRARLLELVRSVDTATARGDPAGVKDRGAIQWFDCEDPSLVGTVAECALSFIARHDRPVFGFAPAGGKLKGSARGTRRLVDSGLDLGKACHEAGSAVGGHGGGHNIASGITVPAGRLDEFLTRAESVVAQQLRLAVPSTTAKGK